MFCKTLQIKQPLTQDQVNQWMQFLVTTKQYGVITDWSSVDKLHELNPEELEGYSIEQVEEQPEFEMWEEFEELNDLED